MYLGPVLFQACLEDDAPLEVFEKILEISPSAPLFQNALLGGCTPLHCLVDRLYMIELCQCVPDIVRTIVRAAPESVHLKHIEVAVPLIDSCLH
jgi:hypothetical protein